MSSKQIILVVESDKCDYLYISTFIKSLIKNNQDYKISCVSMDGKNKYDSKSVQNSIKNKKKEYFNGDSIVVYCYDTDDIFNKYDDKKFDKEITDYCNRNGYELVFFCRDIEEVFLGKRINGNDKRKEAQRFISRNMIESIDFDKLSSENKIIQRSNLYTVISRIIKT